MKKVIGMMLVAGLAAGANAQVWNEIPDAGELVPQVTIGAGALTSITGDTRAANQPGDTGVDMYCIRVMDWANFSASLAGGATFDTQLFLFDMAGMGIATNDDSSGVQSVLGAGNALYAGRTNGEIVMLAVSGYNRDPSSAGGLIFPNTFTGVNGPTGPGGGAALATWGGSPATGAYTLTMTGVSYCEVPAPASLALVGLGGLIAGRRRR